MTEELEVQPVSKEIEQPSSVRDDILNAMQEVQEREENVTSEEKPTRARDEQGKFTKQESAQDVTKEQVTATEGKPEPAQNAPQSWNAAAKAKWSTIPQDIQAEILKREEEVHKGFTRHDEERNFGKQLKEIITPYMPIINAEGGNPAAAVRDLLNTAYQLRTATPQQKGQLLWNIAQQYGADMGSTPPAQAYVDPQIQALQQRLETYEQRMQREEYEKKQSFQNSINAEIEAFAKDPANIHYEEVKAHMAALLQGGLAKDLKEAYDQAVYANPTIRSSLLEQQRAAAEEKRQAEIKAKTQAAKNAAASITGAPGASVPNTAPVQRSLREEIAANLKAYKAS